MFTPAMDLVLSPPERAELVRLPRQTTLSQALAKRIRVGLAMGEGLSYSTIEAQESSTDRFIAIWKRRYLEGGVLALADAPRAGRVHGLSAAMEAKIVRLTVQTKPPAPLTHWSSRRLAKRLGVAHSTVAAVWKRHGLQPHRLERYKASPDPGLTPVELRRLVEVFEERAPEGEPDVGLLPLAEPPPTRDRRGIPVGHIAPPDPGPQDPENPLHARPIVSPRPSPFRLRRRLGKPPRNPRSLGIGQLDLHGPPAR